MLEISAGLFDRGYAVELGGGASAETDELREDEPHPVAVLGAGTKLGKSGLVDALLGVEEALKIAGIAHAAIIGAW
jgi:glucokinase